MGILLNQIRKEMYTLLGNSLQLLIFDPVPNFYNLTSNGLTDAFVCKHDPNGNLIWAKQFGSSLIEQGFSLTLDNSDNVLVVGTFQDTTDFDPGPAVYNMIPVGGVDIFVCKLNSVGDFLWAKQIGGIGNDNIVSGDALESDASNAIYFTGYFSSNVDFDPGPGSYVLNGTGGNRGFIAKLDSLGNFQWAHQLGFYGTSVEIDSNGDVLNGGYFNVSGDFDPGPSTFNLTPFGSNDIFICKLSNNGSFIWAKQIGGIDDERVYSIHTSETNLVLCGGFFKGTPDFHPGPGNSNKTAVGDWDGFVLSLTDAGSFNWVNQIGSDLVDGIY